MKNPKTMEGLLAMLLLVLGGVFAVCGGLVLLGVMTPSARSQIQDPVVLGSVFAALGAGMAAVGGALCAAARAKRRRDARIFAEGQRSNATVERVRLQGFVRWNRRSPYRIGYVYAFEGQERHAQSNLLWEKPAVSAGDRIEIYVDECGRSAMHVQE